MTTTEQTWEKLAWAKKPCPDSILPWKEFPCGSCSDHERHSDTCSDCNGTGKVLLLPDLSEVCLSCYIDDSERMESGLPTLCKVCLGTGRVPKPMHLATLLIAGEQVDIDHLTVTGHILEALRQQGREAVKHRSSLKPVFLNEDIILAVAIEAAWEAVEARHPQEKL